MPTSGVDVKVMVDALETAGWRRRELDGVTMWTLRGFDGVYTITEAFAYVCQGWAAQRLADLVKPWYRDRSVWLSLLASSGGVGTAIVTELLGSQNHYLSGVGMILAAASPYISKWINAQARQAAVLDMRRADAYWAAQPPPTTLGPPGQKGTK